MSTLYDRVGGSETFSLLTQGFYQRVEQDPLLRPMYPPGDLAPAARRLQMFLEQYWGGPDTYSSERGHPRLRMRHMPYVIDEAASQAWLTHMLASLADIDSTRIGDEDRKELATYLTKAAHMLRNN